MRAVGLAVMVLAVGCSAPAQVGTWLWEVTTQNGDAIVEPGETASILLSLDFEPDADPVGPVYGLHAVDFDVIGAGNATLGMIPDDPDGHPGDVLHPWDNAFGEQQTSDGMSLFDVLAGQTLNGPFNNDDPAHILVYEWIPSEYGQYQVTYETVTKSLYLHVDPDDGITNVWDVVEATVVFQVVPAPGATGCLAAGACFLIRRRRQ